MIIGSMTSLQRITILVVLCTTPIITAENIYENIENSYENMVFETKTMVKKGKKKKLYLVQKVQKELEVSILRNQKIKRELRL